MNGIHVIRRMQTKMSCASFSSLLMFHFSTVLFFSQQSRTCFWKRSFRFVTHFKTHESLTRTWWQSFLNRKIHQWTWETITYLYCYFQISAKAFMAMFMHECRVWTISKNPLFQSPLAALSHQWSFRRRALSTPVQTFAALFLASHSRVRDLSTHLSYQSTIPASQWRK